MVCIPLYSRLREDGPHTPLFSSEGDGPRTPLSRTREGVLKVLVIHGSIHIRGGNWVQRYPYANQMSPVH